MRKFPYITVGQILKELEEEGIKISRTTFYRLEKENLFNATDTSIGKWRVFSPTDAAIIKRLIKKNYGFATQD